MYDTLTGLSGDIRIRSAKVVNQDARQYASVHFNLVRSAAACLILSTGRGKAQRESARGGQCLRTEREGKENATRQTLQFRQAQNLGGKGAQAGRLPLRRVQEIRQT